MSLASQAAAKVTGSVTAAAINHFSDEKYVRYTDPAVEPEISNEATLQEQLHEIITRVQAHNFSKHRHGMRATHVKTQAIVKGVFTVQKDLPEELAQGICSPANSDMQLPVAVRFANEPSFLQDDRAPGPRGCGIKIFNVHDDGEGWLDESGKTTQTQDLTFNNAPVLELRDLPTAVEIFRIREANFNDPEQIEKEVGKRSDAALQKAPKQLPNHHFLAHTMYSQSAYRWGPYVCKYALFPRAPDQEKLAKTHAIDENSDEDQHSKWLREWFQSNEAVYDLKIQLCQSIREQSVEDTGNIWDETAFPFRTVGTIVLSSGQDVFSNERRNFWDERMKLNVWYGLKSMRPLGSVNRLRKNLYKLSAKNRSETNLTEFVAVSSINQIP